MTSHLIQCDDSLEEARIKKVYRERSKPSGYYSLFDAGNLFHLQELERKLLKRFRQLGCDSVADARFLEVGCGSGHWLREFIKWGMSPYNVTGVDLRQEPLSIAERLCPQGVTLRCNSGSTLDFPDETFDIVLQATVFTSILDDEMKQRLAYEMLRVVKSTGLIIWHDFHVDNPWNSNVRGVRKAEIKRLFPDCEITLERVSLVLPLTKFLAPWSWSMCHFLDRLRILNTHYLGFIQKR